MPKRDVACDDDSLGSELNRLASRLALPETSLDYRSIAGQLEPARVVRNRVPQRSRHFLLPALFALAAIITVSLPGGRAIASWVGLPNIRLVIGSAEQPPVHDLGLGRVLPLDAAQRAAGFHALLPHIAGLSRPDTVSITGHRFNRKIWLVYRGRRGLPAIPGKVASILLVEFRGDVLKGSLAQTATQVASTQQVRVGRERAFWVRGTHFLYTYGTAEGTVMSDSLRAATSALIWSRGGLTIRFESGLPKELAIALARSIR